MKTKHLIVLLFIITLISVTTTNIFYSLYVIDNVREFNMTLLVGDHAGFDVDTEKIAFGMVKPAGNSCTRYIFVSNKKDYPLKVYISFYGNFIEWVSVSDNYFVLQSDEEKKLLFTASAPGDAAYGNYTGRARFVFKRII